ncbi:MAG: hypothetical protein GY937_05850 [bacterium]|nr:hypothetical protein [bacterium]
MTRRLYSTLHKKLADTKRPKMALGLVAVVCLALFGLHAHGLILLWPKVLALLVPLACLSIVPLMAIGFGFGTGDSAGNEGPAVSLNGWFGAAILDAIGAAALGFLLFALVAK